MLFKRAIGYGILILFLSSCLTEHEYLPTEEENNKVVNEWIYNKMYNYYYWAENLPLRPNYMESPDNFFSSLIFKPGEEDRFSWIVENSQEYQDLLNGIKDTFGFEYVLVYKDSTQNEIYGIIQYVLPDSPASAVHIKRGDIFLQINDVNLNVDNYVSLLSKKTARYLFQDSNNEKSEIQLVATKVKEHPILYKNIYEIENNRIGYLVYNAFNGDSGDNTQLYWNDLLNTFKFFKSNNIAEFILDFRYNPGGSLDLAVKLSSLLVPNIDSKKIALRLEYNEKITDALRGNEDETNLKFSSIPESYIGNQLKRIYIIVGPNTASSSEAVINCLKPYMPVILIGTTTYGKNVGSTMFHFQNEQSDWILQPIILSNCLNFIL
ncbi:peptidase S41 [Bacteroidia bacterium]|nr:peptidase S41 [Bacteroidia bacterium]